MELGDQQDIFQVAEGIHPDDPHIAARGDAIRNAFIEVAFRMEI